MTTHLTAAEYRAQPKVVVDLPWPHKHLSPNARDGFANIRELREVFSYDAETGSIIRIKKTGHNVRLGEEAGWLGAQGYRRVRFKGEVWQAHRLAWAHYYGTNPPNLIDHINGVRDDNRIANLRSATRSINTQNIKSARADNRLGVLGVRRRGGRFEARIMVAGESRQIGTFDTVEEAASAYLSVKRRIHPGGTL